VLLHIREQRARTRHLLILGDGLPTGGSSPSASAGVGGSQKDNLRLFPWVHAFIRTRLSASTGWWGSSIRPMVLLAGRREAEASDFPPSVPVVLLSLLRQTAAPLRIQSAPVIRITWPRCQQSTMTPLKGTGEAIRLATQ
jgi:hypothetical protein